MHNYANEDAVKNESTSMVMGRSLLTHAREIHRYALNYCAHSDANERLDGRTRSSFIRNLKRMLTDMDRLMNLARDKGVFRHCNVEQVDAYIDAAQDVIREHNAVVEIPSLFN